MRPVGLLVPLLLDVMLFGCAWGVVDLTNPELEAEPAVIRGSAVNLYFFGWNCYISTRSRKPHSRGDGESNVQNERLVASKIIVDPGPKHFTVICHEERRWSTGCGWVSDFFIYLKSGHDYKAMMGRNSLQILDTTTGDIVAEKYVYRTCAKYPFRDYSAASDDYEELESQSSTPLTPPH